MNTIKTTPAYYNKTQSVTELTNSIKGLVEVHFPFVTVMGEIANLRRPYSGHLYFTLKDQTAQIKAVIFKPQQRYMESEPQDGREVICRGRISVYEPRGEYQLIVDYIDFQGTGALMAEFHQLKKKLAEEGLFDQSSKQQLPFLPEKIALVTSPKGAAIADFIKIAQGRFAAIPIEVFPVLVQGERAADEIINALHKINAQQNADVIVICRGGGAASDLWTFNEEKVARAIYASLIPVVTGIGHEIDFTLADFAADYRTPTPTAAAEAVLPDKIILQKRLHTLKTQLATTIIKQLDQYQHLIDTYRRIIGSPTSLLDHFVLQLDHTQNLLFHALAAQLHLHKSKLLQITTHLHQQNPKERVIRNQEQIRELTDKLTMIVNLQLERKNNQLQKNALLLNAVSPLAVMGRGYAIALTIPAGQVIRSSQQVNKGDNVKILLHKGQFDCRVTGGQPAPPSNGRDERI